MKISEFLKISAKIKVTWTPGTSDEIDKYRFTGKKADNYKTLKWSALKTLVKNWDDSKRGMSKPNLFLRILVWDSEGKPAHEKLGKDFSLEKLSDAKKYAKSLVEDGKAFMTSLIGMVSAHWFHDGFERLVKNFGTFEKQS